MNAMLRFFRPRSVALVVLAIAGLAILVDRIALYTWEASVLRQFQRYRLSASPEQSSQSSVSLTEVSQPPLWIKALRANDGRSPNPDLLLALEPAIARPNFVSIKGYVATLLYLPPALAWTTRLFPLRPSGLQYRYYRAKDHYGYQIEADFTPADGPPAFKLFRATSSGKQELPPDTHLPELFP